MKLRILSDLRTEPEMARALEGLNARNALGGPNMSDSEERSTFCLELERQGCTAISEGTGRLSADELRAQDCCACSEFAGCYQTMAV